MTHPDARPGRDYRSIVSAPIRSSGRDVDGVLNVIATAPNAFRAVDRTYIALLASVIDVAGAALYAIDQSHEQPTSRQDEPHGP